MDATLQLDSIGSVHLDVNQGYVPVLLGETSKRFVGALRCSDIVSFLPKPFCQRVAHAQLIIHDQQFSLCAHNSLLTIVVPSGPTVATSQELSSASVTVKVVPFPTSDCTSICPPWRSMML